MAPRYALVPDQHGPGGRLQPLAEDGTPLGPPQHVPALAAAVAEREAADRPRWVFAATDSAYAPLLPVRLARSHDLRLAEPLLLGQEGRFGEPRSLGAAWARLRRLPVPADLPESTAEDGQDGLFAPDRLQLPPGTDALEAVVAVHAEQLRRTAAIADPAERHRFRLLAAAESAGGLLAAEMARDGLPWRSDLHDLLLTELLGPRPQVPGAPPRRLAELAAELQQALGGRPFNPDSHGQVLRAFADRGIQLGSTRSWELRRVDHPAAELMIRYKELSRLHAAHGWAWQAAWARNGRFRPEYVVGGVVSGRWATRGGGALQIPRILRRAVVADPGWSLVVADAAQLEPRVLAALSEDAGLARTAAQGDLYEALAATAFHGDRSKAKLGLLGAMYGQTSGDVGPLLATLRRRYPAAMGYVEAAARTGEDGGVVRSRLGRACPPPSADWLDLTEAPETAGEAGGRSARARGRFTRNFVIQASAADWALALLAALRRRLSGLSSGADRPHLVFFQHDEVVVHTPADLADRVAEEVAGAAEEARALVFGDTPVRFPMSTAVVDCYADAK
ncbi:bifunctional 3'-5' exonuclease/DNA polymerase [Kitasatospora sp. DSM 101779]|uniref:bifunctional 3'-5' exonuclease/DNA polymerase n=1 Tax=Kitasatospora sp. DSM 101779 TaxID=2853165 RepID=UPI0021D913B8|nr:bifunctional 3'-5' exonuclease/DNA polymerase [Kitasatospora sp. DSM 101779]MCU7822498.1 bifunctional 3'-5' exonuclease/DNA polymerase [Kitasatospora sp. DSM 101779]